MILSGRGLKQALTLDPGHAEMELALVQMGQAQLELVELEQMELVVL